MALRAAGWRDIPALAEVEEAAFADDPWGEASLWAELARRPRRHYVVAEVDAPGEGEPGRAGAVLGYAGVDLGGDLADVMTLAVRPQARGLGLGARLLEHLHDQARRSGAAAMMLEVRADNAAARSLYDAHGYAVVHTRRGYYRSADAPPVDALVMRKELVRGG